MDRCLTDQADKFQLTDAGAIFNIERLKWDGSQTRLDTAWVEPLIIILLITMRHSNLILAATLCAMPIFVGSASLATSFNRNKPPALTTQPSRVDAVDKFRLLRRGMTIYEAWAVVGQPTWCPGSGHPIEIFVLPDNSTVTLDYPSLFLDSVVHGDEVIMEPTP